MLLKKTPYFDLYEKTPVRVYVYRLKRNILIGAKNKLKISKSVFRSIPVYPIPLNVILL